QERARPQLPGGRARYRPARLEALPPPPPHDARVRARRGGPGNPGRWGRGRRRRRARVAPAVEGIVNRRIERADPATVEAFAGFGVATVHEAQGQTGLLAARIAPIYAGARISGSAVTVAVPTGDNLMIHVAVEECREGDVLVVSPDAASEHGYLGELIATALSTRGVRAFVIDGGVRDVAELRELA